MIKGIKMMVIKGYKSVLVPYDGSESSSLALSIACKIQGVDALHIVTVIPEYEGDMDIFGNIKGDIQAKGEEILKKAKEEAESCNVPIKATLLTGIPDQQITAYAETNHCNLIVMGRKGLSDVERVFIGSVTQRVLNSTSRDVLVIPPTSFNTDGPILVAYDGSPFSQSALQKAIEFVRDTETELMVLNVIFTYGKFFSLPEEAVSELRAKAEGLLESAEKRCLANNVRCSLKITEGEPHIGIKRCVDEVQASMVVIGSRGKRGLNRLILGSVTEKVIAMVDVPVLVVKD